MFVFSITQLEKLFKFNIIFFIICLNLYSQEITEKIITENNIEYSFVVNKEETKKAELIYSILLKKFNPLYKLNKVPIVISKLIKSDKSVPFFAVSYSKDNNSSFKIVFFKNVIENFYKKNLINILQNKVHMDSKKAIEIKPGYFYLKALIHHLSHFSGPSAIQHSSGKSVFIDELLLSNFKIIEEIRADMSSLLITKQLIDSKILSEETKIHLYETHIAHLLYLKDKTEEEKKISSIQLNFLKQNDAISNNIITNKISINMPELKTKINELYEKVKSFENQAETSQATIDAFIKEFSDSTQGGVKNDQLYFNRLYHILIWVTVRWYFNL